MAEKKEASESAIHGLSLVDTTMNDTLHVEEVCKSEDDILVVKIEDEAEATADHGELASSLRVSLF